MKNLIRILLATLILIGTSTIPPVMAQPMLGPAMQWYYSPCRIANNPNPFCPDSLGIYLGTIATGDKGYVGVGASGGAPAAVKVNAQGDLIWSQVYTQSDGQHDGNGEMHDVVEGPDAYVVTGFNYTPARSLFVMKLNKKTGAMLPGFPKWYDAALLPGYPAGEVPIGRSLEAVRSGGNIIGYVIGGASMVVPFAGSDAASQRGGFLLRIDLNGVPVPSFGASGWAITNRAFNGGMTPAIERSGFRRVVALYDNDDPNTGNAIGFIASGEAMNPSLVDHDAMLARTDANGSSTTPNTFVKTYSDAQPASSDFALDDFGYTDVGAPEATVCTGAHAFAENAEELGGDLRQYAANEVLVASDFDVLNDSAWTCGYIDYLLGGNKPYTDKDVALFRINMATGIPLTSVPAPTNAAHFKGSWSDSRMLLTDHEVLLLGADADADHVIIYGELVSLTLDSLHQRWSRGTFNQPQGGGGASYTFGLCTTPDHGYLIAGRWDSGEASSYLLKLGSTCGTNEDTLILPFDTTYHYTAPPGTTVWNQDRTIIGEVIIPAGSTLNITTGTYRFADTRDRTDWSALGNNVFNTYTSSPFVSAPTKIVVKPGGTLHVSGANTLLTGFDGGCPGNSGMWEGIEVWGDPELPQTPWQNQGRLIVDNGARIEHMFGGIACNENRYDDRGHIVHGGGIYVTNGGGIVQMTNAILQDNRYDIYMAPYHDGGKPNKSFFIGTTFKCTGAQPFPDVEMVNNDGDAQGTDRYVQLSEVNHVTFTNCRFRGDSLLVDKERGIGLESENSDFSLIGGTGPVPHFSGLGIGVVDNKIMSFSLARDLRFHNNLLGMLINGGSNAQIINSTFDVPTPADTNTTCGIRIDGCAHADIRGNTFTGMGSGSDSEDNRGIYLHDGGDAANYVGNNSFDRLRIGLHTVGANGPSGTSNAGTSASCNSFATGNYWDWCNNLSGVGQLAQQGAGCGASETQAGNTFVDQGGCSISHSIYSATPFNYIAGNVANAVPTCTTAQVNVQTCAGSNPATCAALVEFCTTAACNQGVIAAMNAELDAQRKEILRSRIIHYYLSVDSIGKAIQQAETWNTPDSKRLLAQLYLRTYQCVNTQLVLNDVGTSSAEDQAFNEIYQYLTNVCNYANPYVYAYYNLPDTLLMVAAGTTHWSHTAQSMPYGSGQPMPELYWEDFDDFSTSVRPSQATPAMTDMFAHPNPFTNTTLITFAPVNQGELLIRDALGRVVERKQIAKGSTSVEVMGVGKPSGVYVASVMEQGSMAGTVRLLVEH